MHLDVKHVLTYKYVKNRVKNVLGYEMFNSTTGKLTWSVHTAGYEIVEADKEAGVQEASLGANFYSSDVQRAYLLKRGVVRAKGEKRHSYEPSQEAQGLGRRLSSMFQYDNPVVQSPTDEQVLRFCDRYGLLVPGRAMLIRDMVQTCKYLHLFVEAIDRGDKAKAREVFNGAVVPGMTVRLVGSKVGRPTANWNLEVQPTNLIAIAWLQIASELTVGKGMKKCEAQDCLEWFPERSNKRFCNNRCKMAFHRMTKQMS
jgi:hypothetical protein